ncbi:DctP family TRAP transporter solute-binding subunit [Alkalihalophilus lindianensis]|uniref:DctP family TRAP transporter solute-binding subunit n=1 Tax=Alkalihalophilus lindianensis TaxID=1630542 RepID=A0ABU3XDS2_9BACI|nr:DctP family TRAP transporter solute-binding subunit [Alkalihalophilus lindianensis]MDV2686035.1 DctP family TRAP transporter solute-binding subunit [Alkalihalophilus lindianensis]
MKKSFLALGLSLAMVLSACGGSETSNEASETEGSGESTTLRLAHSGSESHQYHIAAEKFKELVEEKTDGSVSVDIYPNATLGSEGEVVEQILDGSIDMTTVAADSSFANTVPAMNVFGIPYLFRDRDHIYNVLDGDIGQSLLDDVNERNMVGVGYWEVGFRHLTNNVREVHTPEDAQGLSVRVQPSPVWEAHMRELGANPTPVDFNELYSALDQGVVDGQENPLPTINSMKFYEVQNHVSLTAHTYSPAIVVMSNRAWDGLSEDQQAAVGEAVAEATSYQRDALLDMEEEILQTIKDSGVTVIEDPDREAFQVATENVAEVLSQQVPQELIEDISNVE